MSEFDFDPSRDIAPLANKNNFLPQREYLNPQEYEVVQSAREKTLYPAMERTLKLKDAQRKRQIQDLAYQEAMLTMDQKRIAYEDQQKADAKLGGIANALYTAQQIEDPNERTKMIADIQIQNAEALTKSSWGKTLMDASTFSLAPDFRTKEREQDAVTAAQKREEDMRFKAAAYNLFPNAPWLENMANGETKDLLMGITNSNIRRYNLEQDEKRLAAKLKTINEQRGFFSDIISSRRKDLSDLQDRQKDMMDIVTQAGAQKEMAKTIAEEAGRTTPNADDAVAAKEQYTQMVAELYNIESYETPYGTFSTGIQKGDTIQTRIEKLNTALQAMESAAASGSFELPQQKVMQQVTQEDLPVTPLPVSDRVEASTKAKENVEARTPTPQGPTEEEERILLQMQEAGNN